MNLYSLLPLSASLISASLGIFALRANRRSRLNQIFSLFMFSAGLWSLSSFFIYNSPSPEAAFLWDKTETFGSLLAASFMLHFCLLFTKSALLKRRLFVVLMYVPTFFFTYINVTTRMITFSQEPSYWGYSMMPGDVYYILAGWIALYAIAAALSCFIFSRRTNSEKERRQALLLTAGIAVMIVGGVISEIVMPLLGIEMMPLTSTLTALNGILVAYAIARYKLMVLTPSIAADNILKTIADYMMVFNKDGTIAFVNDSALEAVGIGRRVIGAKLDGVFDEGVLLSIFGRLGKEGMIRDVRSSMRLKDGKSIPVSLNCSAVKDGSGTLMGYVIVAKDMTRINELIENLKSRTADLEKSQSQLNEKIAEAERFNKLAVGRELKMVELKKRIKQLEQQKAR